MSKGTGNDVLYQQFIIIKKAEQAAQRVCRLLVQLIKDGFIGVDVVIPNCNNLKCCILETIF